MSPQVKAKRDADLNRMRSRRHKDCPVCCVPVLVNFRSGKLRFHWYGSTVVSPSTTPCKGSGLVVKEGKYDDR